MLDYLIVDGTIIDGTGEIRRKGTVGIQGGKLVMDPKDPVAKEVISAEGKIVCPGFIDPHSHGDRLVGTEDGRLFKTPQGITTELCGNCGSSYAPIPPRNRSVMYDEINFVYPPEVTDQWVDFDRFLSYIETRPLSANARFYVGHKMLRLAAMGVENRPASAAEIDYMKSLLRECMQAGAAGMSTGLIYVPSCYSTPEEVQALAAVVAEYNGMYTSHIRNEAEAVVEAVDEVLEVGRKTGVRLNISHHKVQGKDNWGKQKITLEMIHRANEEGIETTMDLYPYLRSMNNMRSCVPPWHFSDGNEAFVKRLSDPAFRNQLREEMSSPDTKYDNFYRNAGGWEGVYVASTENTPKAEGKFIADYAREIGNDPFETYFDLMEQNETFMMGVYCTMNADDMCQIVQSPYCVIGTDGCTKDWKSKGHPRASAAFPKAIEYFVKEKGIFTLEQMIHKMTGLTARRLSVKNKGILKDGFDADVLILDVENLKIRSTYDDPNCKTEGIDCVIVGGKCVYRDLEFTGTYSGKVIRGI
ncbi:MAG: D-aminoacylase [Clostridia bacterium]|nr:D-aminoacylase [Clostridia bacterium]